MSGSVFISEVGSRTLAKLQEQECQHTLFYVFFFHVSFPRLLKTSLILLPSIFSEFGQLLASSVCAQLSLLHQTLAHQQCLQWLNSLPVRSTVECFAVAANLITAPLRPGKPCLWPPEHQLSVYISASVHQFNTLHIRCNTDTPCVLSLCWTALCSVTMRVCKYPCVHAHMLPWSLSLFKWCHLYYIQL